MQHTVDERRLIYLNNIPIGSRPIVYWMSRDQRLNDNWALLYAQNLAFERKAPLVVLFCLVPEFIGATLRHYRFMLQGLAELETALQKLGIGFYLVTGKPEAEIPLFCRSYNAGALISDFSPLRINRNWKTQITNTINTAFIEVDAHNIIPCWVASPKQEYAAYTIRSKIKRLLPDFFTDIPPVVKHPYAMPENAPATDWLKSENSLLVDKTVSSAAQFKPGEGAAQQAMQQFIEEKLHRYNANRNDPTKDGVSNLSPYLHFGQLSAQRLAYSVKQSEEPGVETSGFLEELIIRRELSDNFCYYCESYDSVESFSRWAKETLADHASDPREHLYTADEFESAQTHDPLWNAAQTEMVRRGKMHGYMRMYWAKKILEWTESAEEALALAIYLNDKYSLDGRDPNGYAGIAWSIGGVHDRAWFQRPIFGKIRYMSYNGAKSKFDVARYIEIVSALS